MWYVVMMLGEAGEEEVYRTRSRLWAWAMLDLLSTIREQPFVLRMESDDVHHTEN